MSAGQLRERITLLTDFPAEPDGQGGFLPAASGAVETVVWGKVEALRGTAQLALGAVATGQVFTVTIRTNGPLTPYPNQRLRWKARSLSVQLVQPTQARDYWLLTCFDNGRN